MKYYSEKLKKNFDTVEELETEERAKKSELMAEAKKTEEKNKQIAEAKKAMEDAYRDVERSREVCKEKTDIYYKARKEYDRLYRAKNGNGCCNGFGGIEDWFYSFFS